MPDAETRMPGIQMPSIRMHPSSAAAICGAVPLIFGPHGVSR